MCLSKDPTAASNDVDPPSGVACGSSTEGVMRRELASVCPELTSGLPTPGLAAARAACAVGLMLCSVSCLPIDEEEPDPPEPTWVEERPFPDVQVLTGVHVHHADLAFAVGSEGTILRFTGEVVDELTGEREPGGGWVEDESGVNVLLTDVHGRYWADDDLDVTFAVGEQGTILRHTADGWIQLASPVDTRLNGVWVRNQNDAYIVGDDGRILRWTGAELDAVVEMRAESVQTRMVADTDADGNPILDGNGDPVLVEEDYWRSDSLKSVMGTSGENIFAVGPNGFVFHFDGTAWTLEESRSSRPFQRLYTQNVVWVSTTDGYLLRRRTEEVEGEGTVVTWADDDAFRTPLEVTLKDVYSLGGNDLFAVGYAGAVFHRHEGGDPDDNGWETVRLDDRDTQMRSIHGTVTADATEVAPRERLVIAVGAGGRMIRGPTVIPFPVVDEEE